MENLVNFNFLSQNIEKLSGVGKKTKILLKRKKIEKIGDLLWNLPYASIDRSKIYTLDQLEIGKISTIKVEPIKYSIPRKRNLPNKVTCRDSNGTIDIVFFNSRESYIKKVLPIGNWVVISGKVNFYKNKYQITNPQYIVPLDQRDYVQKKIAKYELTDGISEKVYRKLVDQVLNNLPDIKEWHTEEILKNLNFSSWKNSILKLHDPNEKKSLTSDYYKRLVFDEIFANLIVLSKLREKVKKNKKERKVFSDYLSNLIIKNFKYDLTLNQKVILNEINKDLKSEQKMFRLVQGDVGSGKTIISLIAAGNVVNSGYQVAIMSPTEILSNQHFILAKKLFSNSSIKIDYLTRAKNIKEIKKTLSDLKNNKTNIIIGTHALFQNKVHFKNLGLIIIDEQHKFGVKQRMQLAKKGGDNCDVLVMSATPIPRTLIMTFYGDMDVSKLIEKPSYQKKIITLSKPDHKISEVLEFVKRQIKMKDQIFWVCPLIDESKILDYSAANKKFIFLNNIFPDRVGLIHGDINKEQKNQVIKKFQNKNLDILVSTTVVEVGVNFPHANTIIIENSNKFGLSQLHQLRGRVGRGSVQGTCILMYKNNLSDNAKKRIKILKSTNDGFMIAEEDLKLRGFGDILGYKQSGIKSFIFADPIHHSDLFKIAEKYIKKIKKSENDIKKFLPLLKLFDQAEIINELKFY